MTEGVKISEALALRRLVRTSTYVIAELHRDGGMLGHILCARRPSGWAATLDLAEAAARPLRLDPSLVTSGLALGLAEVFGDAFALGALQTWLTQEVTGGVPPGITVCGAETGNLLLLVDAVTDVG